MYLIDTNIFLEILLSQPQKDICKGFLVTNAEHLYISDFSLHSIGVILFRNNKELVFKKFVKDVIQKVQILSLSEEAYEELSDKKKRFGLDFDDAYQFMIAKEYALAIVTQDKDFKTVSEEIGVVFL
jgi:predicted nucleic acid-binding protein